MIKIKRKNIEQCVKKFPKEIKKKNCFYFFTFKFIRLLAKICCLFEDGIISI